MNSTTHRENYRAVKDSLIDIFDELGTLSREIYTHQESGREESHETRSIQERKETLVKNEFSVVVIGEIKRGKSTLLNALLHKPVFPKDVLEATATVSFLRHNDTAPNADWRNKAVVHFYDSREPVVADHLALRKYSTVFDKDLKVAEEVESITIYSDSPFSNDNVTVVDTPGTNTVHKEHLRITMEQVDKSNAAIFLFKAGTPGSRSDFSFLKEVSSKINHFFFLINRIDEIAEEDRERVVEDITAKLKKEVPDLAYENLRKPYTISGLKALLGRYGYVQNELIRIEDKDSLNNQEYRSRLLKESGVEEFEKDLMKYLFNGNRVEKLLDSHFRYLQDFMHRIETCLKNRMETLEGDVSLEELDQKLERLEYEIKKQKDEMNRTTDSLVNKLDLSLGNAITAIEQNLDSKYQELKDTLEGIQEFSELAVNWDDGMKLSTVATGMLEMLRHKAVNYLGEAVTSVFREYDRRLRAKLSAGLQEHGILNLPELPEVNITFTAPNLSGELEEELIATREKIQQIDQEIDNYYNHSDPDVKIRYNELLESKKSCRIDYEQKIHKLGMRPQVVRYEKEVTKTRWRRGALGIMTTILCGKEDYTDFETICDSSAQEEYDDIVGKIEKECDSQLKKYSSKLNDLGRQLSAEQKQERLAGRKKDLRRQLEQTKFEMEKRFHSKKAREEKRALQKCMNGIKRSFTAGAETIRLILGESRNKCRQWADDYVANLMVELDEVTADSRFEFENLKTLQADSIEKRDKTLQILNKLEVKLTVVREKYDSALDLFSALDLTI